MADEITGSCSLSVTTPGGEVYSYQQNFTADQPENEFVEANVQAVGTSAENLDVGDVSAVGPLIIKNLDATNFVQIGYDDTGFVALFDLLPGESCLLPRPSSGVTLQVKADTGAVNIRRLITDVTPTP